MSLGIIFDDIHSGEYKAVVKSENRHLLAPLIRRTKAIPLKHGVYDYGGNTYDVKTLEITLRYVGTSYHELRTRARDISAWLAGVKGAKRLIFDDEPNLYYLAKVYEAIPLSNNGRVGESRIIFECQPFALYHESSGTELTWGSYMTWESEFAWGDPVPYQIAVTGNTSLNIDYFSTQEVGLGSPDGSKFDIKISGSFTTLSISLNGKTITYGAAVSNKQVVIDNVNATVELNGVNALANCSGDLTSFLKLIPGTNTASISGTGLNCTITFDFTPQYI
jgi:predicted phage tail component-like protein